MHFLFHLLSLLILILILLFLFHYDSFPILPIRSFLEGDFSPPVSTHGTPRRTIVIALTQAASLMFEYGCISLGRECVKLAEIR